MTQNICPEPVIALDADQAAVAKRLVKDAHFALATISHGLDGPEPLNRELAKNCLAVAEYHLRDLGKTMSIETNGAAEIDARNTKLRAANERIRELEAHLGNSQSTELTQMSVKRLAGRVNEWWRHEGFGHVGEIAFGPYGVDIKFSCHLFGDFRLVDSPTPISDREAKALWYASLADRGFVLCVESGERDAGVDDCDKSRQALVSLITGRMPSARVTGFRGEGRKGQFLLREASVFVGSYADILSLPCPANSDS